MYNTKPWQRPAGLSTEHNLTLIAIVQTKPDKQSMVTFVDLNTIHVYTDK